MDNYFTLLIASLAVFRLSEFVAVDSGPFFLMRRLRASCKGWPALCELINCPYCCGGWWSLIAAIYLNPGAYSLVTWWFGIWGGSAVILRSVRERKRGI